MVEQDRHLLEVFNNLKYLQIHADFQQISAMQHTYFWKMRL
jgi:hypothetical protein